jgi:hypothetical protein
MTGDKTKRAYVIEDIICYSYQLVPYCIWFYLPSGHLSGLGSHFNCPTLSYKRPPPPKFKTSMVAPLGGAGDRSDNGHHRS